MMRLFEFVALSALSASAINGSPSRVLMGGYNPDPIENDVDSLPQELSASFCTVGVSGVYGSDGGNKTIIGFKYQVEFNPDIEESIDNILPALEIAVVDQVLPVLFGTQCNRRQRMLRSTPIIGASTSPRDLALKELDCPVSFDMKYSCEVIDGQMTAYTDGGSFDQVGDIEQKIKEAMDDGEFNNGVHGAIVRVHHLELEINGNQNDKKNGLGAPDTAATNGLTPPFYVVIAVGSLAMILAAVVWRRLKFDNATSILSDEMPSTDTADCGVNDSCEPSVGATLDTSASLDFSSVQHSLDFGPIRE